MTEYFPKEVSLRIPAIILIVLTGSMIYFHEKGFDITINWEIVSQAETENFVAHTFSKGPFDFELEGQKYFITETFGGSDITHNPMLSRVLIYIIWIGICGILAVSTVWKRFWFIVIAALAIVFINFLDLDALDVLGGRPGKKWLTMAMMVVLLIPTYYLHAFKPALRYFLKWLFVALPSTVLLMTLDVLSPVFVPHFIANAHISLSILCILFIFLIAEEILFLILFFLTQSRGGRHNEKHFIIFSLVYLGFLGVYYGKKAGFIDIGFSFLNPYYLLSISLLVSLWSTRFKQELYDSVLAFSSDIRYILITLGIVSVAFLNLGFLRGNDPAYEAMHYVIVYAHLAFGFMFLMYTLVNFISPIMQGFQVYKIAYKEYSFPYVSSRLAGLAIVAGFFFLSDREVQKMMRGARYNYQGDLYQLNGDAGLAQEYYRQGSIFSWDNHYSNYMLGTAGLAKNDFDEAVYRFTRAKYKIPSPYTYVNTANSHFALKEEGKILSLLQEGSLLFPQSAELNNNLAIALNNRGNPEEASRLMNSISGKTEKWNNAVQVNKWMLGHDSSNLLKEYNIDNAALKSNIIAQCENDPAVRTLWLDTGLLEGSPNLHRIAYLINASWMFTDSIPRKYSDRYQVETTLSILERNLAHSQAINLYRSGNINQAFRKFDLLQNNASEPERGFFLNQFGLLALEQDAPRLASDYFEKAKTLNYREAFFNDVIANLEARNWTGAMRLWADLLERDSSFAEMSDFIDPIIKGQNNNSFAFRYYRIFDFQPAGVRSFVGELETAQLAMLWKRIVQEHAVQGSFDRLEEFYTIFSPFLPQDEVQYFTSVQSDLEGGPEVDNTYLANVFDEIRILAVIRSGKFTDMEKYNILLEAIDINPYSTVLIREYCMAAVAMGLFDYGDQALSRLHNLLPSSEFDIFEENYNEAKMKRSGDTWTF